MFLLYDRRFRGYKGLKHFPGSDFTILLGRSNGPRESVTDLYALKTGIFGDKTGKAKVELGGPHL